MFRDNRLPISLTIEESKRAKKMIKWFDDGDILPSDLFVLRNSRYRIDQVIDVHYCPFIKCADCWEVHYIRIIKTEEWKKKVVFCCPERDVKVPF